MAVVSAQLSDRVLTSLCMEEVQLSILQQFRSRVSGNALPDWKREQRREEMA
jgi:hypothetical protein